MKNWNNKGRPAKNQSNPFDNNSANNESSSNGVHRYANNVRRGRSNTNGYYSVAAQLPTPTSLFPPWLSSWMVFTRNNVSDDDSDLFHDCLSKIDIHDDYSISSYEEEKETTSLLRKPKSPQRSKQSNNLYNSISPTPLRSNIIQTQHNINGDDNLLLQQHHDADSIAVPSSPLANALSWISSPYGRYRDRENADMQQSSNSNRNSNTIIHTPKRTVQFGQNSRKRNNGNLTALQRAMSSPELMSMTPMKINDDDDEDEEQLRRQQQRSSNIVLKEVDTDIGNDADDVLHPWTKLILLEELGTAWSWFVLLLPYAFMILAVILDGDPHLKNTTVGPLGGNNTCANVANYSMPSTFEVSAKGYFPVPFRYESETSSGSCSYPFELREGVGLLAHGMSPEFNSTVLSSASPSISSGKSSIVDGRYRHLMSHGSAFTSGVISDVPATSQSLQGVAKFNNLSNEAVAMVARGSVLVSAIVFQRQRPSRDTSPPQTVPGRTNETISKANISSDVQQWSPVLILNPKKLDMFCKLRRKRHTSTTSIDPSEPIRWDCTSRHIVDAFYALPNTAVLIGGDIRVDVLLSYRVPLTSITSSAWMNEEFANNGVHDDYFSYDSNGDTNLSDAEKLLLKADLSVSHKGLLTEISEKSVYKLEHESVLYENVVEITRIMAFVITVAFVCYWWLSMIAIYEDPDHKDAVNPVRRFKQKIEYMWKQINESYFWWESPWVTFPERRYLQLLLLCLILLQNPLLSYAYFHPSLYSSTRFRCVADSLSGISIQGVLFLWLALVHGLRYQ